MVKSTLLPPFPRRAALSLILACAMAAAVSLFVASRRAAVTAARLDRAERELERLTERPTGPLERGAIAWGYAERMRLGLESPFLLIEAASRDSRMTADEQRTVAWALLATVLRGESHQVDAAAFDRLTRGRRVPGEAHLSLIEERIREQEDPRAGELAVRMAYALAVSERGVDAAALPIAAQAAALIADREIGRREAAQQLRTSRTNALITTIVKVRRQKDFYVERPVLMAPPRSLEEDAIALVPALLAELRGLATGASGDSAVVGAPTAFQEALLASASQLHPNAEITVTGKRFLPALRAALSDDEVHRLAAAHNPEMLAAALAGDWSRAERVLLGRLHLAAAAAMRSHAQELPWFPGDSVPTLHDLGVAGVAFDAGVPRAWRGYYLTSFATSVRNLRTVFPQLRLDGIDVRFRVKSPADSALAMHEPKSRTLHLPVTTASGTLTHEFAHDLDRQMSMQQGRAGYWSDAVSRGVDARSKGSANRVAAALRAVTEESAGRRGTKSSDRPAEIFATRVDWFVAQALARRGLASGFLSGVQDEVLTGHVLHTERLRGSSRSRSLLTALEGMTSVAPFARSEGEPTAYSILQYVLREPLDRRINATPNAVLPPAPPLCAAAPRDASGLVRLAAESRARGLMRARAESMAPDRRPTWARAVMAEAPWSDAAATASAREIAAQFLGQLSAPGLLQVGVGSRVDALVQGARCDE